ncbi:MAG TPA: choice-of-anchor B family protein [Actinomycetota bacterium]|nr:choice-of-anchor B family protein [Actinomycetota bacterium]
MRTKVSLLAALALVAATLVPGLQATAQPISGAQSNKRCVDGRAGFFPCKNVDLKSFLPSADLEGGEMSDIWGWADPKTKREYALMGSSEGLKIIDVTKPAKPIYLGTLIKPDSALVWQDVETYKNYAFVVCDLSPCGLQIFDLTRLRGVTAPQQWTPDLVYPFSLATHSLDINVATGYAYLNGSYASGGNHIVDISDPMAPVSAGQAQDDGYTHDSHCRIYRGPDKAYKESEICFNANEDTVTIHDVSNKLLPVQLARVGYENASYTHQAWLTEDHTHILVADETDESTHGINATTYIFNVKDLDNPKFVGKYVSHSTFIDHNNYIKGNLDYQAALTGGLRVLNLKRVAKGKLKEIGYFDNVPQSDAPEFDGSWGVYPYLPSGNILASGMGQGLFVLRHRR